MRVYHTLIPFTIDRYDDMLKAWQATPGIGLSSADDRESITRYLERNPGGSFIC